jgi:hypothetical protein
MFKRGDVVIYIHKNAPPEGKGALAIVEAVENNLVTVQWITYTDYLLSRMMPPIPLKGDTVPSSGWELQSFEKIGEISLDKKTLE